MTEQNRILDDIFGYALSSLQNGYVDTFYFECDWPGTNIEYQKTPMIDFNVCKQDPYTPTFILMKPSDVKINPYTGKKMERVRITYPSP